MSIVFTDVFVSDFPVFVYDEDRSRGQTVAEEVKDVVADWHVVVLAGVQDGEVGTGFGDDRLGAAEVVGADSQHFCTSV